PISLPQGVSPSGSHAFFPDDRHHFPETRVVTSRDLFPTQSPPMQLWLCPIIAFLLGSIPFGLFIARAKGIDIRCHGSGNIGATNVLRVVGKKYGITCLILDALKGFVPVVIALNLIQIEGRRVGIPVALLDGFAGEPL